MKRLLVTLCAVLICSTALAAPRIKIQEVGFGSWVTAQYPNSVRVSITSDRALNGEIVLRVKSSNYLTKIEDLFVLPVHLEVGQSREIPVPAVTRGWAEMEFTAELRSKDGTVLAGDEFDGKLSQAGPGTVAVLCQGSACEQVQKSILFSGSDEENERKNSQLKLLTTPRPRDQWWEYAVAGYVVVAMPVSSMSESQRTALEGYVRAGGKLVLVQGALQDTAWLGAYRERAQERTGTAVGNGRLRQVADVTSPELGRMFNADVANGIVGPILPYRSGVPSNFMERNSMRFRFPTAAWLLGAMCVYIVLIGLVNFAILRRLRKLYWGWVTVPVVAFLFAAFLYVYSSSQRPTHAELDEVTISWMDAKSGMAFLDHKVRVSSPSTTEMTLYAPSQAILMTADFKTLSTIQEFAGEFGRQAKSVRDGTQVRFGEQTELPLSMLRWSAKDVSLGEVKETGGTVELANGKLFNRSGRSFKDAIVWDGLGRKVYLLGSVAAGAEIDLSTAKTSGIQVVSSDMRVRLEQTEPPPPFDIREVVLEGSAGGNVFYGLADGPTLGATLSNEGFNHRTAALTVVRLD